MNRKLDIAFWLVMLAAYSWFVVPIVRDNVRELRLGFESDAWPRARAEITGGNLRFVTSRGRPTNDTYAELTYSYSIAGRDYAGTRVEFLTDARFYTPDTGRDVLRRYPNGAIVPVWYDPEEPSESVLEPGLSVSRVISAADLHAKRNPAHLQHRSVFEPRVRPRDRYPGGYERAAAAGVEVVDADAVRIASQADGEAAHRRGDDAEIGVQRAADGQRGTGDHRHFEGRIVCFETREAEERHQINPRSIARSTARVRSRTPSFASTLEMWFFTVPSEIFSSSEISRLL